MLLKHLLETEIITPEQQAQCLSSCPQPLPVLISLITRGGDFICFAIKCLWSRIPRHGRRSILQGPPIAITESWFSNTEFNRWLKKLQISFPTSPHLAGQQLMWYVFYNTPQIYSVFTIQIPIILEYTTCSPLTRKLLQNEREVTSMQLGSILPVWQLLERTSVHIIIPSFGKLPDTNKLFIDADV